MVAYKKITKDAKRNICIRMANNLYNKSEVKKLVNELQREYKYEMTKNIPDEVKEFAKKYPKSIKENEYNLCIRSFLPREDRWQTSTLFDWPYVTTGKTIVGFLNDNKLNDTFYVDYHLVVNYIKRNNIELYNKFTNILIPKLKEIDDFTRSLKCAIEKITTVNKLKEEIPEAYDIYVEIYGEPAESFPCNKKKTSFCDTIEKIRMVYNKNNN